MAMYTHARTHTFTNVKYFLTRQTNNEFINVKKLRVITDQNETNW